MVFASLPLMSRPLRIDLPFSLYHVISRSNSGECAFLDSRDHEKFLSYLVEYAALFSFKIHAFCLMSTHFHLLIESSDQPRLSELMRRLLTAYTVYFNRRHKRHGHLFQGRFKSYCVDKADYLLQVSRYIHLNPADAPSPHDPENYSGSSLRYYIRGGAPEWLYEKEILGWFKLDRKKYARFVREGLTEENVLPIHQQKFIGGEPFARRIWQRLQKATEPKDAPDAEKKPPELARAEIARAEQIIEAVARRFDCAPSLIKGGRYGKTPLSRARSAAIFLLRRELPWSLGQTAAYLSLSNELSVLYHIRKIKSDELMMEEMEKIKIV